MFKFIFGVIWTAIVTPMFIIFGLLSNELGGIGAKIFVFIFFGIFEVIGLYMLISGIKKISKDNNTKKYGIQCYGIVSDIQTTGSYVNDNPEYKAILYFVNPETKQLEDIEEIIGFDYDKYPINSFIVGKYYEGDINLENNISENEIPEEIKALLTSKKHFVDFTNIEMSADKEYVTIDGVQYKRVQ